MICTSLIMTRPPGMIGASPNKTRKRSGVISTSLIEIGPHEMNGARPKQDPEEVRNDKYMTYLDQTIWNNRCKP